MRSLVAQFLKRKYSAAAGENSTRTVEEEVAEIELDPLFIANYRQWLNENIVYNDNEESSIEQQEREDLLMFRLNSSGNVLPNGSLSGSDNNVNIHGNTINDGEYEGLSDEELISGLGSGEQLTDSAVMLATEDAADGENDSGDSVDMNENDNDIAVSDKDEILTSVTSVGTSSTLLSNAGTITEHSTAMHVDELDF